MADPSDQNGETSPDEMQPRYPPGYWDEADEYLTQCYILQHNQDYLEFLVKRVWRLEEACRLAEFGCGAGKIGLQLMPLLARGSTYAGFDQSSRLVSRGHQIWSGTPWWADFCEGSIYEAPFADRSFDVTLTHTVLMHVPYPEKALQEMVRVTRPGGLVIACEANRNAHTAMLHIEECNHQETTPLELNDRHQLLAPPANTPRCSFPVQPRPARECPGRRSTRRHRRRPGQGRSPSQQS
jgi:SAM-dependent methyltransferase